jgi:hypothetical protein
MSIRQSGIYAVAALLVFSTFASAQHGSLVPDHHKKKHLGSGSPSCTGGPLAPGNGGDLEVTGPCSVLAGSYQYRNVNIYGGGSLTFSDAVIDFWAQSILVENRGSLIAGSPANPIGSAGGLVTIHLYGNDQGASGAGIECKTDVRCGVDPSIWTMTPSNKVTLPGGVTDYFYAYSPMDYDNADPNAYFGYKVLGVSYGGTLNLFGMKGATYGNLQPSESGKSWARLNTSLVAGQMTLTLDRQVDWQAGDEIVITATDYVPRHSEHATIAGVATGANGTEITLSTGVQYPHNGQVFPLDKVPEGIGPDAIPNTPGAPRWVETRAAVALLTRSIRIVSGGDNLLDPFPQEATGYYFGGHTVFRQGFQSVQLQGVEFRQMGQGGRIMHYPVHFHMARKTPPNTFVADCSAYESMTRWYVIHASQGITLARNVGYLSIGHGYYLEDGTETDNKFYSNIGILARAAVDNASVNPRKVPGIFSQPYPAFNQPQEMVPFHSDIDHPTVFWIMNAYNDFEYNMAVSAETCGACYWLVPGSISGMSRMEKWESYASEQTGLDRAATTPLYKFEGNYCSTAMNSFNTIGNTTPCLGVVNVDPGSESPQLKAVSNPLPIPDERNYYPTVDTGGGRFPTVCPADGSDCSTALKCSSGQTQNCTVTVLDRYTTAFNWTETNFAAIWLRPQWYLLLNSAISDVQNGGLTFVSGGGYSRSDVVQGRWALARKSAFIGNTQDPTVNPFASNAGPFNSATPLRCATQVNSSANVGNFCLAADEGLSMPLSTFGVNQRLFSIYDGPAYQDSNAYLNISKTLLTDCQPQPNGGTCAQSASMYGQLISIPKDTMNQCYLPNAAIAWKQPNGFYYPPAFHSSNLFFDSVDIRHFVIEPLFSTSGLYKTDSNAVANRYCTWNDALFTGFTDIDRQTELNDDDGSLTGLVNTVSVNQDPFFNAPIETPECASDVPENVPPGTARTSPYDYVTTVEMPGFGYGNPGHWSLDCSTPACYGVPLYREFTVAGENLNRRKFRVTEETQNAAIRMAGQSTAQRSTLTVNHGRYYLDTTVSAADQSSVAPNLNVFDPGQTYYTFLLFAKPSTAQTYDLYVGPGFNLETGVFAARADISSSPTQFTPDQWPATWSKQYDSNSGVLTVTMNMDFDEFKTDYSASGQDLCKPQNFCSLQSATNSCGCALPSSDGLFKECQSVCGKWAGNDIDCPKGRCFGFGVTLPPGFTTGPKPNLPPSPQCFPQDNDWNTPFTPASPSVAGKCYYNSLPQPNFCPAFLRRR